MKKLLLLSFVSVVFFFTSCGKTPEEKQTAKEINNRKFALSVNEEIKAVHKDQDARLDQFMSQMSTAEKVSQLFIINLEGKETFRPIDRIDVSYLSGQYKGKTFSYVPGGYLFFSYNLAETPEKVKEFTDNIKAYFNDITSLIPPFLAVDEEGGDVQRLRKLAGKLPSQMETAGSMSVPQAYEMYRDHAKKVKDMGFHMNLAPVVESLSEYNKGFLNDRSFGNTDETINYSIAAMNAYQNEGIACVLKHFPGNTNTDPHSGLPEITLSESEMEEALKTFERVVALGPKAVLMSHARTSLIDPDVPACFSKTWVTEKLRKEMGFEGIIFSDDIFMGALAKNGYPPETACVKAIEAGVDVIMISEKRFLSPAMVLVEKAESDPSFMARIDESCRRVLKYKIESGIIWNLSDR